MRSRLPLAAFVLAASACANDSSLVNAPLPGCEGAGESAQGISSDATVSTPARVARRAQTPPTVAPPPSSFAAYATADDLVRAMGRDPEAGTPAILVGSPLASAVFQGLGDLDATQGNSFVWLSTGVAGAGTDSAVGSAPDGTQDGTSFGMGGCEGPETFDCVQLRYTFVAPDDANSVRFDFHFLSTEYPEYIGQGYNDTFFVTMESPSHNFDNISFDGHGNRVGIDSAFFDATCSDVEGTGFDVYDFGACDAGATGLLGTVAPVEPGETVTLTFTLNDAGDGIYDSAVLLDNLQTTSNEVEAPTTNDCE